MTKKIYRVSRGGCWYDSARYCRSAYRYRFVSGVRLYCLGFRPAFKLLQKQLTPENSNDKDSAQI